MRQDETIFTYGNDAMVEGAIAAGARFYAGYPITPSSEVAKIASERMPQVGGVFVQMEDELSSMASILGASAAGKKAFTATSGPGLSLMQENLGVGAMAEVPCVIIDVQRGGPSTGLATKPAQGDLMAARWGTHGDHSIIAISPSSVQDCYDLMIDAFNLSEKYRTPVIFLADEIVGHMREQYVRWEVCSEDIVSRKSPAGEPGLFRVAGFEDEEDGIAALPSFGSPYIMRLNGSGHDAYGLPCGKPEVISALVHHLTEKIEDNCDDITILREYEMEDAEYAIISFGCSARPAKAAVKRARELGIRVGLLQLVTVWPFPSKQITEVMKRVKAVIVPEMNLGQLRSEVEKYNVNQIPVVGVNHVNAKIITPAEIMEVLQEVSK